MKDAKAYRMILKSSLHCFCQHPSYPWLVLHLGYTAASVQNHCWLQKSSLTDDFMGLTVFAEIIVNSRESAKNAFEIELPAKKYVSPGNSFKHGLITKGIASVHHVPQPNPANANFISVFTIKPHSQIRGFLTLPWTGILIKQQLRPRGIFSLNSV